MPRRRRGLGPLNLLQKLIKLHVDSLKKQDDQRAISAQQKLADQMEAEVMKSLATASEEHADLVENLRQIREKLGNEEFLYVSMESDLAEVCNFRWKHGYRGGVKIVGKQRLHLKYVAIRYGLQVIE